MAGVRAGRGITRCRCGRWTCRCVNSLAGDVLDGELHLGASIRLAIRWRRWPRPQATPTRSAGGTTSSSIAAMAPPAFDAVAEAMTAVRGGVGGLDRCAKRAARRTCARRCARAIADGHQRIAVVCGAWHVPALAEPLPAGVGRRRHAARPARRSRSASAGCRGPTAAWPPPPGTAPGVRSPGWYAHVFDNPGERVSAAGSSTRRGCCASRGMSASPDDLIAATRAATAWPRCATARGPVWPRCSTPPTR